MRPESNLFGFWRVANEEDRVRDWRAYADDIRNEELLLHPGVIMELDEIRKRAFVLY